MKKYIYNADENTLQWLLNRYIINGKIYKYAPEGFIAVNDGTDWIIYDRYKKQVIVLVPTMNEQPITWAQLKGVKYTLTAVEDFRKK